MRNGLPHRIGLADEHVHVAVQPLSNSLPETGDILVRSVLGIKEIDPRPHLFLWRHIVFRLESRYIAYLQPDEVIEI